MISGKVLSFLLLFSLVSVISGCGYHLISASSGKEGRLSLFVPVAKNSTSKPLVETRFTETFIRVASERGIRIAESGSSDLTVKAEIRTFDISPSAYSSEDRILLYKSHLTVHISVINSRNVKLMDELLEEEGDLPVKPELSIQKGVEMSIAAELSEKISERFLKHINSLRTE